MEKKIKHKGDLRTVILEAAKKLFVQEGYEATSIRKIAKEIGFSPTTIYLYYKDKSDIVYALHQVGFNMLKDQFVPLMTVEDPFERLKALGRIYMKFAFSHPEYYQVMFMMREPLSFLNGQLGDNSWVEGELVIELLKHTIVECQSLGYFKGMDPVFITIQLWSSVHGLVSLHITQHLDCISDVFGQSGEMEEMLNSSFQVLIGLINSSK
ncbi:TetR/AcrR family transcriptional regulator [Sphingobacterium cellulitidis]|uniref:TetR family transcriptional regulator n=1 Tax=Sphingobacterium cellulitidis TaxID=1768011 RepID=A0A8H9G126_9SPHI|nr:TetR/AcrR family transcriptional regulator [Sphingobacterium soli]MBA8988186.1 AcrR family transcriptional regulator [Sphingobacterium soli]GGE30656.1 TetR family transcriptional regulator [Sphingobacterium soli]